MANTTKKHDRGFKYATRPEYRGLNMQTIAMRPGALDVLNRPSRVRNTLFFPNGTILKDKQ
jgi:hypothetical protein